MEISMKKLMNISCDHYYCSDGYDNQYPKCSIYKGDPRVSCPAKDIINILEKLDIEIVGGD